MYRKKSPAEACHPLKLNMPIRLKPCRGTALQHAHAAYRSCQLPSNP